MPTETVYGLAADACNDAAVAQIFAAKGRPADHPLIVHIANAKLADHFAHSIPDFARALMVAFWPGPLTLILPRHPGVAGAAAGHQPTVGLRCPAHPVALALLNFGLNGLNWGQIPINLGNSSSTPKQLESDPNYSNYFGLAAPSANLFGRVSPTTAQHVHDEFGDDLLILDGGPCQVGIESTIVDCTRGQPVLLRPGAITLAQLLTVCEPQALLNTEQTAHTAPAPKASGTLESHYAPKARVRLFDAVTLQQRLRLLPAPTAAATNLATPKPLAIWSRTRLDVSHWVVHRTMPADATQTAQQLFAQLRAFDAAGVTEIWVEAPPEGSDWDGVRDRLQRAAH
jgi:L-threonylcarbamoyladenylate synthase